MNKQRKLLLAALAAGSITCAVPAFAAVDVFVDVAPPAPRYEVLPAPRAGYVWQPGYWSWDHGRHTWHKGYWVKERRGYYWHPARWEHRNGRYHFVQGRWDRERYARNDRDHDGIPNRYDRDRDNDGVPNRYDDHPNNPNRR
jgi:hypothetical protein